VGGWVGGLCKNAQKTGKKPGKNAKNREKNDFWIFLSKNPKIDFFGFF
jgi:hypothetical protein